MTTVIQNTPTIITTEIDFLADDVNKGFKVRVNSDLEISIFDLGQGLTGQSRDAIRKTWSTLKKQHPRIEGKYRDSKFIGLRKKTQACDVDTAIELVMLWPGKAAATFREQCARTIRRVMSGDESLVAEIRDNAQRTDDVTQLMQATTEREQQPVQPGPIRGRDEDWYVVRELKQKAVHHQRQAAMKRRFPGAGKWQYIQWNVALSETVTGYKPKDFSRVTGAKKNDRRSYYSIKQLHMLSIMDHSGIEFFENPTELPTWKSVQDDFKGLCDETREFSKKIKIHGGHFKNPPPRSVLTYKKAIALEKHAIENGKISREQDFDRRVFRLCPERIERDTQRRLNL